MVSKNTEYTCEKFQIGGSTVTMIILSLKDKLLPIKVSLVAFVKKSVSVHYVWGLLQPYFSEIRKYPYKTFHLEIQQ